MTYQNLWQLFTLQTSDTKMKFWYKVNKLRSRIGEITDYYGLYVEIRDLESGEYVIIHWTLIEPI